MKRICLRCGVEEGKKIPCNVFGKNYNKHLYMKHKKQKVYWAGFVKNKIATVFPDEGLPHLDIYDARWKVQSVDVRKVIIKEVK